MAAAPAIVRASSIMRIAVPSDELWYPRFVDPYSPSYIEQFIKVQHDPATALLTGELGCIDRFRIIESPFVGSLSELEHYKRRGKARRKRAPQPSEALQKLLYKARDLSKIKTQKL
jgi:hypothetical protein